MRKFLAIILVIMMCLSLCACGNADQSPANSKKNEEVYEAALQLLEESATLEEGASEKIEEAYDLLVSLEDYEGARAYLSKITQKECCVAREIVNYDKFGQETFKLNSGILRYEYDHTGQISFELQVQDEVETSRTSKEYDLAGNLIKEILKRNDEVSSISTYSYNDAGQCISFSVENNNGRTEKSNYQYDENGNMCREDCTYHFEEMTILYVYDTENRLIEQSGFIDAYKIEEAKYTYALNANGYIQSRSMDFITYDGSGRDYTRVENYIYDDSGNLVTIEKYDENQNLVAKETYTYETLYFYNP